MEAPTTASEIIASLREAAEDCAARCLAMRAEDFNTQALDKWSAAQNLDHLIKSTDPLTQGLKMPKLALRAMGKPNRPGRGYDEIVAKYQAKLAAGGAAMGPYLAAEGALDQQELVDKWRKSVEKLIAAIEKNWSDEAKLDDYLLPHPLLGKLMVREMLFFTLYHTRHHTLAIEVQSQNL